MLTPENGMRNGAAKSDGNALGCGVSAVAGKEASDGPALTVSNDGGDATTVDVPATTSSAGADPPPGPSKGGCSSEANTLRVAAEGAQRVDDSEEIEITPRADAVAASWDVSAIDGGTSCAVPSLGPSVKTDGPSEESRTDDGGTIRPDGDDDDPVAREMERLRKQVQSLKLLKKRKEEEERARREDMLRRQKEEEERARREELRRREQIRLEEERLRREAEALEKLRRLKEEEEELRRWLVQQEQEKEQEQLILQPAQVQPSVCVEQQPAPMLNYSSGYSHEPTSSSGMRQIKKTDNIITKRSVFSQSSHAEIDNAGDVERQSKMPLAASRAKRGGRGFAVPTRILLRKILVAVLTDLDDATLRRDDTERILIWITLIKEAILGVLIAFAIVSLVLFLDHRFVLGMHTARNFRRATFHLLSSDENLRNFEEDSGLKFMPMDEYERRRNDIDDARRQLKVLEVALKARMRDLEGFKEDVKNHGEEYPKLYKALELNQFCEECLWSESRKVTCIQRVKSLESHYGISKPAATLRAMKKKACKKSKRAIKEEDKQATLKKEEDKLLKDWDKNAKDFCPDCEWETGMSCIMRTKFLNERYGIPLDRSMAMTMVENQKCKDSYYVEDNKYIAKFCAECDWGWNGKIRLTCKQRVEFLMYTYRNPERVAKMAAMEKPTCSINYESQSGDN